MRTEFRLQKSYARVFRVGEVIAGRPECQYQTIQDAIDAAEAAGHTSHQNGAIIEIYDKGSPYVENLILKPGISLVGIGANGGRRVEINGNVSFAPTTQSRAENRLYCENLNFNGHSSSAAASMLVAGSAGLEINFWNCGFYREVEDGEAAIHLNSSAGNNCRVRFTDCDVFFADYTNSNQVAILIATTCRVVFSGQNADFFADGDAHRLFDISASAQVSVYGDNRTGTGLSYGTTGVGFSLHDQAVLRLLNTSLETGSHSIEADSNDVNVNVINCYLSTNPDSGSFVMNGTGGATPSVALSNCYYNGFGNDNGGGIVGSTVYLDYNAVTPRMCVENVNDHVYAYVGGGVFRTIQAAIDFIKDYVGVTSNGQGVVVVDPGFYPDNIELPNGIKIIGKPTYADQRPSIGGTITFVNDGNFNQSSEIQNMQFGNDDGVPSIVLDSPLGGDLYLRGCEGYKNEDTIPIIQYQVGNTAQLSMYETKINRFAANPGAVVVDLPDAGQRISIVNSQVYGSTGMILATGNGQISVSANSYLYNRNMIGDSIELNEFALTLPRGTNGDVNTAIVGGPSGYESIQQAVDALYTQRSLNGRDGVIYLAPGGYTEDITVPEGIYFVGSVTGIANNDTYGFMSLDTFIFGTVTLNGTGAANKFYNLSINPTNGNPAMILSSDGTQLFMENCALFSDHDDGIALMTCNMPNTNYLLFKNCSFNKTTTILSTMIDFSAASADINPRFTDCVFNFNCDEGVAIDMGNIQFISFFRGAIRGQMKSAVSVNGNNGYEFFGTVVQGAMSQCFYYAGAGDVTVHGGAHVDPNYGNERMVARDGGQATANIELTSNVFPGGSGFDINGSNFIAGTDFAVGVDEAATAVNLAQAINDAANPGIGNDPNLVDKIYAIANGVNVELYAVIFSSAANSYALNNISSAPANLTAFAGGVDGSGGTLTYGAMTFGNPRTQNTLTYNQLANTVTAV